MSSSLSEQMAISVGVYEATSRGLHIGFSDYFGWDHGHESGTSAETGYNWNKTSSAVQDSVVSLTVGHMLGISTISI